MTTFTFDNGRWVTVHVWRCDETGLRVVVKDEQRRTLATEENLTKNPYEFNRFIWGRNRTQRAFDKVMRCLENAKSKYDVWRLKLEIHTLRASIDYIRYIPVCNCEDYCDCEATWQNAMRHKQETIAAIRKLRAQIKTL